MKAYLIKWTRKQLWEGCILASIAHAIMVAHFPESANEHSWDGMNYSVQNSAGARGTITFHPENCVAAFRDDNNKHTIFGSLLDEYFKVVPKQVVDLANNETLQYLLDEVDGEITPVITTVFWENENKLFAGDDFDEMISNGGFLLENQVMNYDLAVQAWVDYYDMSSEQVELLKSIYSRKIANPEDKIILTKDELKKIGTHDKEGLNESKASFEEINIEWES